MDADAAIFVTEATAAVASALVAVTRRDPRTSVIALAIMLAAVASVFMSLGALLIAAAAIVVCAGDVALLLGGAHGVGTAAPVHARARPELAALLIALLAIGLLAVAITREGGGPNTLGPADDPVEAIAMLLFGRWAVVLLATAVLVAAALLAVVARARSAPDEAGA